MILQDLSEFQALAICHLKNAHRKKNLDRNPASDSLACQFFFKIIVESYSIIRLVKCEI